MEHIFIKYILGNVFKTSLFPKDWQSSPCFSLESSTNGNYKNATFYSILALQIMDQQLVQNSALGLET